LQVSPFKARPCLTAKPHSSSAPVTPPAAPSRAFGSDARHEAAVATLVQTIESEVGPIAVAVFNIGASLRAAQAGSGTGVDDRAAASRLHHLGHIAAHQEAGQCAHLPHLAVKRGSAS